MNMKQLMLRLFGAALLIFTTPMTSVAQEEELETSSVSVSPPILEVEGAVGEEVSVSLKLSNPSSKPLYYKLYPSGFIIGEKGLIGKPLQTLPPDNLARNMTFEAAKFFLPPRSFKEVTVFLKVPKAVGTHYAGIVVENASSHAKIDLERRGEFERSIGAAVSPAINVTVKLFIKGTEKYQYSFESLSVKKKQGNKPMELGVIVKNNGNAEIRANALLVLQNKETKKTYRLKGKKFLILEPGVTKEYMLEPPVRPIPKGSHSAVLSLVNARTALPPSEKQVAIP
jgi:hypothetical protein